MPSAIEEALIGALGIPPWTSSRLLRPASIWEYLVEPALPNSLRRRLKIACVEIRYVDVRGRVCCW
jgi:hypothetical protein